MRRERPAVVLLDLLMPDVDGFEVVEQLRADPYGRRRADRRADVQGHDAAPTTSGSPGRSASWPRRAPFRHAELVDLVGARRRASRTAGEEAP